MLMNDFKKVRGYNPILFLRTAIESSKPASRGATRVAAGPRMGMTVPTTIAECRNFLCLISWGHSTAARRRKAADCGTMWHFSVAGGTTEAFGGKRWRIAAPTSLPATTFRQQTRVVEHKG